MPRQYNLDDFNLGESEGQDSSLITSEKKGRRQYNLDDFNLETDQGDIGKKDESEYTSTIPALLRSGLSAVATIDEQVGGGIEYLGETPERRRQVVKDALSTLQKRGAPEPGTERKPYPTPEHWTWGKLAEAAASEVVGGAGDVIKWGRGTDVAKKLAVWKAENVLKRATGKIPSADILEKIFSTIYPFPLKAGLLPAKVESEAKKQINNYLKTGDIESLKKAQGLLKQGKGFGDKSWVEKNIAEPVASEGRKFAAASKRAAEWVRPNTKPGSLLYYGTGAIEGVLPSLGIGIATTLLTKNPELGLATMFPTVYGQVYHEQRAEGKSTTESARTAFYYATTEVLSEGTPLGFITKTGGKFLTKVFKSATAEGLQETINEAMQIAYDEGVIDKHTPPEEIWRRLVDAGIMGAVGGGGAAIVLHPFTKGKDKGNASKLKKDFIDSIVETGKGKGKQEAVGAFKEGFMRDLFDENDIKQIKENAPEIADEVSKIVDAYGKGEVAEGTEAGANPIFDLLEEGMTTGEVQGHPFTSEDAAAVIKEAHDKGIINDQQVAQLKEKYPGLKPKSNDIAWGEEGEPGLESREEHPFLSLLNKGIATGEIQGKPFTTEDAISIIKKGYGTIITDEHIEALKEKYPELRPGLNDIVGDALKDKISNELDLGQETTASNLEGSVPLAPLGAPTPPLFEGPIVSGAEIEAEATPEGEATPEDEATPEIIEEPINKEGGGRRFAKKQAKESADEAGEKKADEVSNFDIVKGIEIQKEVVNTNARIIDSYGKQIENELKLDNLWSEDKISGLEDAINRATKRQNDALDKLKHLEQRYREEAEKRKQQRTEAEAKTKIVEAKAEAKAKEKTEAKEAKTPATGIGQESIENLNIDAPRFQYKRFLGKKGVSSKLKSIKQYNPELGGIVSVWRDPIDNKLYVINGHHRYELAKRTGQKDLTVRYLEAKNAEEAKLKGALINIAENQGTPEDAALVFRQNDITPETIGELYGVSLKGKVAEEGMALAGLEPGIFHKIEIGEFPKNWGIAIGGKLNGDFDAQIELLALLKKKGKKQNISVGIIEQIIDDIQNAGKTTETQTSLFGDEIKTRPLLIERAELKDYALNKLLSDKRLFGAVSKEGEAARLSKAGNVIEAKENKKLSDEAGQLASTFSKLASYAGPINDTINNYAEELSNATTQGQRDATKRKFFDAIRDSIQKEIPGIQKEVSERAKRHGKGREFDTGSAKGEEVSVIPYSEDLDIRNIDAMPKGVGARYLEVIEGQNGAFIAKQWRRKPSKKGIFIDLKPGKKATSEVEDTGEEGIKDGDIKYHTLSVKEARNKFKFKQQSFEFEQRSFDFSQPTKTVPKARRSRIRMATTGYIASDGNIVRNTEDAAALLASIRKSAQEFCYGITTDKDGVVLEIHKYTKGLGDQSQLKPIEYVGHVLTMPGARSFYFVHNHPSEGTTPSEADYMVRDKIEGLLKLNGVKTHSLIIGGTKYGDFTSNAKEEKDLSIRPTIRKVALPVKERKITKRGTGLKILSSIDVDTYLTNSGNKYKDGFVLLDAAHQVIEFIPYPKGETPVKAAAKLVSQFDMSGIAATIFNSPNQQVLGGARQEFLKSLHLMIGKGIVLLDVIDQGHSMADRDTLKSVMPHPDKMIHPDYEWAIAELKKQPPLFKERKTAEAKGKFKAKDLQSKVDEITARWENSPLVEVVQSQTELSERILSGVAEDDIIDAVYDNGKVIIVADNMASIEDTVRALIHESFGHHGLRKSLGPEFEKIMGDVYAAKQTEIQKVADNYEYDTTTREGRILSAEEWLAREAVSNPTSTWVRKVMRAIRRFARRLLPSLRLSMDEITQILEDARHYVERGIVADRGGVNQFAQDVRFSAEKKAGAFYSQVIKTVETKMPAKMQASSVINWLRKQPGIKAAELEWMNIEELLEGKKSVGRDELVELLKENQVVVEEVIKGRGVNIKKTEKAQSKFDNLLEKVKTLADTYPSETRSKKIQEKINALGDKMNEMHDEWADEYDFINKKDLVGDTTEFSEYQLEGKKRNYREVFLTMPNAKEHSWKDGHPQYSDVKNPIVRLRINTRIDKKGDKILFLEEIQKPRPEQQKDMPSFARKYAIEMGLKRLIRMAAEEGFNKIVWITGQQTADRYDLSEQIDELYWNPNNEQIYGYNDGHKIITEKINKDNLSAFIGKDAAQKLLKSPLVDGQHELKSSDLKIGGNWAFNLYDKMIPQYLKKFGKKYGGTVGTTEIDITGWLSERQYVGDSYTVEDVKKALAVSEKGGPDIFESPITGEQQTFAVNRVRVTRDLRTLQKDMEAGISFTDAITKSSSPVGELFGGAIELIPQSETQQSFTITSKLKQVALREGMPLFQMAGKKAIGADKGALQRAQTMLAEGMDKKKVWRKTGWLKGTENKWKFEIDDSGAKIKIPGYVNLFLENALQKGFITKEEVEYYKDRKGEPRRQTKKFWRINSKAQKAGDFKLEDIIDHLLLFKAYPQLKNTRVEYPGYGMQAGDNIIHIPDAEQYPSMYDQKWYREALLHEIQHLIQYIEGFAIGGATSDISYNRLAGEIEARDTSARSKLTTKQRREQFPYESQGIPENQWIVTDGDGTSFSAEKGKAVIPKFKTSEGAKAFGKEATPGQVIELKRLYKESLSKGEEIKSSDFNAKMREATRGQFYRKAFEAAEKRGPNIQETLKDKKISGKESRNLSAKVKAEIKEKRKSKEIASNSPIRFTNLIEIKHMLKTGEHFVGRNAEGSLGISASVIPKEFAIVAYGNKTKVPVAIVYPGEAIESIGVQPNEVMINPLTKLDSLRFIIGGHSKLYTLKELKDLWPKSKKVSTEKELLKAERFSEIEDIISNLEKENKGMGVQFSKRKADLKALREAGVKIDKSNIATVYRGGNVSKEGLRQLRYGDFLSAVKEGKDTTGNAGAAEYGKNVVILKIPAKDLKVTNGELQYIGESKSLKGGKKYPEEIYKAYNDYYGSNYTAKEIDKQDNVKLVASMALSGGREEFDALMSKTNKPTVRFPTGKNKAQDKGVQFSKRKAEKPKMSPEMRKIFSKHLEVTIKTKEEIKPITKNVMGHLKGLLNKGQDIGTWEKGKPNTTIADRILSTPLHYFKKVPALWRMFETAQEKVDNQNMMLDRITKHPATDEYYTTIISDAKKSNKSEYERYKKRRIKEDADAKGYRIIPPKKGETTFSIMNSHGEIEKTGITSDEQAALDMIDLQVEDWRMAGFSEGILKALRADKMIVNNGFNVLMQNMRDVIAWHEEHDLPLPETTIEVENEKVNIDLKVALATMGDRRGYYFPRNREPGKYALIATQKGKAPFIKFYDVGMENAPDEVGNINLLKKVFNSATPMGLQARKLEKQGYTNISMKKSGKTTEDVFEMAGSVVAMQEKINGAMDKMENLEDVDKEVMGMFAKSLAEQVANIDKGRGSRKHMIRRRTAVGEKEVWQGYETDPLRALSQYAAGIAGGESKKVMALKLIRQFTGTDITWPEFSEALEYEGTFEDYQEDYQGTALNEELFKEINQPGSTEKYEDRVALLKERLKGVAKKSVEEKRIKKEIEEARSWEYLQYKKLVNERRVSNAKQENAYHDGTVFMKDMLRNDETMDRILSTIKGVAVFKYLAGRVIAPVINFTALPTIVPPIIHTYTGIPLSRALRLVGKSLVVYKDYKFRGDKIPAEDAWVFKEIEKKGWDKSQYNREALAGLESKLSGGWKTTVEALMWGFGVSEQINRCATIHAAYKAARSKPGVSKEEALSTAKTVSDKAHSDYSKANKPIWTRGSGLAVNLARAAYVFKNFSHNYLLNMKAAWGPGWTPEHAKAFSWMAVAPAVLAGGGALIGKELLLAALKALGIGGDDPEEEFYTWAFDTFGAIGERVARYGAFGLLGINLKGSLSIGITDIPTTIPDILGAPGSMLIKDPQYMYESFKRGAYLKGVEKAPITPLFLSNPIKGYRELTQGLTTFSNEPIFYGNEPVVGTLSEFAYRVLSINPTRISRIREKQWSERRITTHYREEKTRVRALAKKFFLTKKRDKQDWRNLLEEMARFNKKAEDAISKGLAVKFTLKDLVRIEKQIKKAPKRERERNEKGRY